MILFHCTHLLLQAGDMIHPGNWGKMMATIGHQHPCWEREFSLESVRQKFYPQKPSRLTSCFACDNINTIHYYQEKYCPNGFIYVVEIVGDDALIHKGDFNALQPLPGHCADMNQIAHRYWQYELKTGLAEWPAVECSELVIGSSLQIRQRAHLNRRGKGRSDKHAGARDVHELT